MAVVRDVSARPTADERAHIFEVAVGAAANGIAITDAAGNFVYVNEAFTKLTGFRAEEVIGQSTRLLKSGRHDASFYGHLWATITRGDVWHGETVNRRKDGSLYVEEQTIAPVRATSGAITHYVAIKHDITARRSAEEALRRRIRELSVLHRLAVLSTEAVDVQTFATRLAMTLREHLDLVAVELDVSDQTASVSPTDGALPSFRAGPAAPASGDTLVFPLWVAGRKLGELRVRVRPYDLERPELERFLETFATQAASAFSRALLQEEVRRLERR
ncbi:MAG: PAS domain S-box protein [Deltaproteobacteria bacterium]|nr:PAS domain S-box protein [Deltaproteobacteria bacterium]